MASKRKQYQKKLEAMSTVELAVECDRLIKEVNEGLKTMENQVSDLVLAIHGRRLYIVPPPAKPGSRKG